MTRWLVTGAGGMLGTDLVAALTSRGEPTGRAMSSGRRGCTGRTGRTSSVP